LILLAKWACQNMVYTIKEKSLNKGIFHSNDFESGLQTKEAAQLLSGFFCL